MRAANTGITAVFDAFGRERGRLPRGEPGVLVERLPGRVAPTWFSRICLRLPAGLAVGVLICGLITPMRRGDSLEARG
jgi:apolipoprotein N-acyltransferase